MGDVDETRGDATIGDATIYEYVKSPCIRVCTFESWLDKKVAANEDELCVGCFRTKGEIRTWNNETEEWRKKVRENAKERRKNKEIMNRIKVHKQIIKKIQENNLHTG